MNHFKTGDLAIIAKVSGAEFVENLGRVVVVIEIDPLDQRFDVHISAEHLLAWSDDTETPFRSSDLWLPHSWLIPLRGDFQPEGENSKGVSA